MVKYLILVCCSCAAFVTTAETIYVGIRQGSGDFAPIADVYPFFPGIYSTMMDLRVETVAQGLTGDLRGPLKLSFLRKEWWSARNHQRDHLDLRILVLTTQSDARGFRPISFVEIWAPHKDRGQETLVMRVSSRLLSAKVDGEGQLRVSFAPEDAEYLISEAERLGLDLKRSATLFVDFGGDMIRWHLSDSERKDMFHLHFWQKCWRFLASI